MHQKKTYTLILNTFLLVTLSSCSAVNEMTGKTSKEAGKAIGGLIGIIAGDKVKGKNRAYAIMGAGLLSVYLGGKIGETLDEKNKESMNQAAQKTLRSGKVQTWGNPKTNVSGRVEPIGKITKSTKGNCQKIRHVVTKNGRKQTEDVTACKNANGQWKV